MLWGFWGSFSYKKNSYKKRVVFELKNILKIKIFKKFKQILNHLETE